MQLSFFENSNTDLIDVLKQIMLIIVNQFVDLNWDNNMTLKQGVQSKKDKSRFGSKDVEAFYNSCLKSINEVDVGYFYKVVTKHNMTEIIVCNMFKLRFDGRDLSYYKYLFKSKRWQNIKHSKNCYSDYVINRLLLIETTSTLYKRFLTEAVLEIIYRKKDEFIDKKNQLSFEKIKSIVLAKLLKKAAKPNAPMLGKSFMRMLWDTLINKEVYSYCMRIYLKPPTLEQYCTILKMDLAALRRIGEENPNLFPVLSFLQPNEITAYNLFSKKRWIKSNYIDEQSIILPIQFTSKSSWHFFKQLSSRLVKRFLYEAREAHQDHALWVIDSLMKIPNILKQNVYFIHFMIDFLYRLGETGCVPLCYQINENQRTVFMNALMDQVLFTRNRLTPSVFKRLFVYRNFKTNDINGEYHTFKNQIRDMLDYLVANQHVHLRKNKTFNSLMLDTRQWEQAVAMTKNRNLMNITWHKLFPDTVINNYLVKELNTGLEVYLEGKDMHHCIQRYINIAKNNQYKIFSIQLHIDSTNTSERATLGVIWSKRNKTWTLEQVRGVCNADVSETIHEVSKQIITELNKTALNG